MKQASGSDNKFCVSIQTLSMLDVIEKTCYYHIYYSYHLIAYFPDKYSVWMASVDAW